MVSKVLVFTLALIIAASVGAYGETDDQLKCNGIWSNSGKLPFSSYEKIYSPDGKGYLSGEGEALYFVNGKGVKTAMEANAPLTEVIWSPNSKYFAINTSDGGLVGTWDLHLYRLDQYGNPQKIKLDETVKDRANILPMCDEPEIANIGLVGWMSNGRELLVATEVPPHSSCVNMGDFRVLKVSLQSGKIMETEKYKKIKDEHILGCRLLER